jgi:hypothetical protein
MGAVIALRINLLLEIKFFKTAQTKFHSVVVLSTYLGVPGSNLDPQTGCPD